MGIATTVAALLARAVARRALAVLTVLPVLGAALALASTGASAAGAGGAVAAAGLQPLPPLRLAVSSGPVSLPIYVAKAQGYFEREGLALRLVPCSSGRQCFELLREQQADLATAAELVMTLASLSGLAGADAAIIATISASAHQIKLVAHGGTGGGTGGNTGGIQAPDDLRGKRIGTVKGTSAQYFLDSWLLFHQIDPKDVTVVALAPDQLAGALQRRDVHAVAIWDPVASAAAAALGADARVLPSPRVYTQHFNLIASRAAIGQRDADLLRLLRALAQAERFIAAQPGPARQILQTALQADPGSALIVAHDYRLTLAQSLIGTMDGQARWALREGLAPAGGGAAGLLRSIEPGPLRRAVPGAVSLVP